jgi:hypothetical protein
MSEKSEDRDTTHSMFGLSEPQARPARADETNTGGSPILVLLVAALVVLSGVNLYLSLTTRSEFKDALSKHADQLNLLTRRLDSSDERYAGLKATFQVAGKSLGLTQKELSHARSLAADIQKQQQESVQQLNDAIGKKASAEELSKLQTEADAKFGAISGDLAGTKKDLEDTKAALTGAKGELTGAIARTHDELVALAHRTDRDYYEFNLERKGSRQKLGAVMLELAKTNPKKNQFTVNLYYDDKRTERKDKSLNEPLYFYVKGAPNALELVVNKLAKDSVAGYISVPKGFLGETPSVLTGRPGA